MNEMLLEQRPLLGHMVPGLLLAISTNVMIPFGGPILEGVWVWWLAPATLGIWLFGLVGYCLPLMVNGMPFRAGTVYHRILRRHAWAFEQFIFLSRCTMPAGVETASLMLWIAFVARPTEPTLMAIVLPLVPVLILTHFTWQLLRERKTKGAVEHGG